ncbi:protein of unknown function [Pseudomonas mediterranea]
MPAAKLLSELKSLGVELWPQDGQLKFRAPQGLLDATRLEQLRTHKQQILELLHTQERAQVVADAGSRHAPFPLTDVQNAYLLGRQSSFGYGNVACHGYLELSWPRLDPQRVEQAWNRLIARHDMLRAVIASEGSQRVLADVPPYRVAVQDLRAATDDARQQAVRQIRQAMEQKLYPTEQWPLFELRLSRSDSGDTLHFSMDSLIADWASAQLLFNELEQLLQDPDTPLPPLDISFRDYLLAERRLLEGSRHQRDRAYWLNRVDELPAAPQLPAPLATEDSTTPCFRRHRARLDRQQWTALKSAASDHGLTPSIVVLTAYVGVLQRWSQQPAFSLNLTLLNRLPLHPQVDRLVGDFTSVSLLQVNDPTGLDFTAQARQLGSQLFADLEHRLFSGIQVMREIGRRRGREAAAMPVVFTSAIGLAIEPPAASQRQVGHGITQTPQVTLDCQVMDDSHGLHIHWDVRQGVFPDGLIDDMLLAFSTELQHLAGDPAAWMLSGAGAPAGLATARAPGGQCHGRAYSRRSIARQPAGHGTTTSGRTRRDRCRREPDLRRARPPRTGRRGHPARSRLPFARTGGDSHAQGRRAGGSGLRCVAGGRRLPATRQQRPGCPPRPGVGQRPGASCAGPVPCAAPHRVARSAALALGGPASTRGGHLRTGHRQPRRPRLRDLHLRFHRRAQGGDDQSPRGTQYRARHQSTLPGRRRRPGTGPGTAEFRPVGV